MPKKIDTYADLMKAQALDDEKSKILLVFLISYCGADDLFNKGIHAGLRYLERKTSTAPPMDLKEDEVTK